MAVEHSGRTMVKNVTHLHANYCLYQVSTFYTLRFWIYNSDKILKVKVTSKKVKLRSYHAYSTPENLNQCLYQVSTAYTLWLPSYISDKILRVKITTTRSNHNYTMTQPHYTATTSTNVQTKYPISILHLTVSELEPRQDFSATHPPECLHTHMDTIW